MIEACDHSLALTPFRNRVANLQNRSRRALKYHLRHHQSTAMLYVKVAIPSVSDGTLRFESPTDGPTSLRLINMEHLAEMTE